MSFSDKPQFDNNLHPSRGFSLVETVIGTAIFLIVALGVYNTYVSLIQLAAAAQARTLAVQLADEQFEIVRNMPYVSVGLTNGIPIGILPQNQVLNRGGYNFNVTLTVRNINLSTSTVQASNKLVEVQVDCPLCKNFQPITLTGQVSPANLQSASNGGALVIHVFDSSGQPIEGADVQVQSLATSSIQNHDVTDKYGTLNIIGVPRGINTYRVTVTKSGYSTDRTYPVGGAGNPNPNNPDATVLDQQVTEASFSIDRLSNMVISSVSPICTPTSNITFSVTGSKQIGTGVLKYPTTNLSTNASGLLTLSNLEWDTYSVVPTSVSHDVEGLNPFSPIVLNPNNTQNIQLIVLPANENSLMVSIEDSSTNLPISGASVQLTKIGYDVTKITGQGYLQQSNWSHGPIQDGLFTDNSAYASDNGNIDTNTSTSSGNINMHWWTNVGYQTTATGTLDSSTFDTGTSSNFFALNWNPVSQPANAGTMSALFQFAAANNSSGPWNYIGPDGSANSYFDVSGRQISQSLNGNRYARFRTFLTTATTTVTPLISNVSFSYTSGCIPPGQVLFQGLTSGTYTLQVTANGYTSYSAPITITNGWQQTTILMGP